MRVRLYDAYAGPQTWGPWVTVGEHLGEVTFTITEEAVGDTIIRCNVRYFNDENKQVVKEWADEVTVKTGNSVAIVEVRFMGIPLGSAVKGTVTP